MAIGKHKFVNTDEIFFVIAAVGRSCCKVRDCNWFQLRLHKLRGEEIWSLW
jgi:hypothetical protein